MWKIRPTKNHECMKTFHPTSDEKKKNKGLKNWMKNLTSKLWMKTFHLDEN
jgi:hypothetical protein